MATYTDGSVTIIVGSQTVTGNNTRFDLHIQANDYFKLTTNSVLYTIADVVSSTQLTLSGRYADSSNETSRTNEHLATIDMSATGYSGTLSNTPVITNSMTVIASSVTWEDNGAGVLATTSGGGTGKDGTISYDDGSWTVSFTATTGLASDLTITASYNSGDTLNAMSYQIVRDFTDHYLFPEMSDNDAHIEHIFTKAMRLIDSAIYNASINTATVDNIKVNDTLTASKIEASNLIVFNATINNTVTASEVVASVIKSQNYIQLGAHQYIFFGKLETRASVEAYATSIDASVKGSMYMSNYATPMQWFFTSDTQATQTFSY